MHRLRRQLEHLEPAGVFAPDLAHCLLRQLEAAGQVAARGLTVAQTEALVEQLLAGPPTVRRRPTLILKDVRLFLNTLSRSLELVRSAGVDAQCRRQDTDEEILLTIHIPRRAT